MAKKDANTEATEPAQTPTRTLLARINSFVEDVATLDVLTVTGSLELIDVAGAYDAAAGGFRWDTLMENVTKGMKPSDANKLEVVAYTHAEWDFDSVNFVKKELSAGDQTLVTAHHAAVEAAQKSRFEAVRIVAGLVGLKIPTS